MSSIANPSRIKPCSHLSTLKETNGVNTYEPIENLIKTSPKSQSPTPRCSSCSKTHARLYLCLTCSEIHCLDHSSTHLESNFTHKIAFDISRSELYCLFCNDQVYDAEFDAKIGRRDNWWHKRKNLAAESSGLRGLNNLGNTCFMNSVLQALLHIPPLKDHFLGHRDVCRQRRRRRAAVAGEVSCLACDVNGVFTAVFSGDRRPYSPAGFLYSWWQHSANFASYEQQDAHEFFISILDRIHEKEQPSLPNRGTGDCHCIAHRVFSGVLRSDVTCTICGFTSTTYDPCVDISLDLESSTGNTVPSGKSAKPKKEPTTSSLVGCLDLFTRPEKLGSDQKLYCQHCQVRQDSVKQMSIRRLPLVLCFHIKRFEHSLIRRTSKKIDQYLNFPISLDMTPYLASSIIRKRFGSRIFAFEGDESDMSTKLSSEFEVFAVVSHMGRLDSGHYVTFLRLRDQWYKCDDAWITQVSEGVVKASEGYMMYYVQKALYYRAGDEVNCFKNGGHY